MKNKSFIFAAIIISCLLITGCGKEKTNNSNNILEKISNSGKKTCTQKTTDEDGYTTTDTMIITYKNNKVTKVENTNISENDPEYVDLSVNFGKTFAEKLNEVDGFKVEYTKEDDNKIKMYIGVDFNKINPDDIKEHLGEYYTEDDDVFYLKKDINIDDFTSEYTDEYICD